MSGGRLGPVHVVTASAGTGKTHRLTTEVGAAVSAGTVASAVLATTFTTRAAAELMSRARAMLVEAGRRKDAELLLAGRFGTVNSVFGALLREFAFEGGRSPVSEVIPEERAQALFRMAADVAIGDYAGRLQAVAERLGYAEGGGRHISWRDLVSQVVALSRANGIAAEQLGDSRDRSWLGLEPLLGQARKGETAEDLDKALAAAVEVAIQAAGAGDGTKATLTALQRLKEVGAALASGRPLPWQQWAQMAKIKAAMATDPLLDGVRAAAAAHARHPRLRNDLEAMIGGVFDCAAEALVAYRDYKLARGLVDFSDQEAEALRLLERPEVTRILAQRLDLALIDEFQDTSPIQLALFLRIARIARRNFWVGDPKQSIYGFRGSDPDLMSAVAGRIAAESGGSRETLTKSYRARPGLLKLFNDVFIPAFEPQGIPRPQSECRDAERADAPGQAIPLAVWQVAGSNKETRVAALAGGVRRMLADPGPWSIVPKGEAVARPVRGGDVAILCRTKETCREVAAALEAAGLQVALGRDGLLQSAECALALACLRWLADPSDTLALAEIAHLTNAAVDGAQPGWFSTALEHADGIARLRAGPIPVALDALRPGLLSMTPAEVLDAAIGAAAVVGLATSWGNPEQRLVNIDALRALAVGYEDDRRQSRQPATPGGLVGWLEEAGAEKPASGDDHSVVISTYHAAKGLEWPVTLLFELNFSREARLFNQVIAEGAVGGIDLDDPLKGRWLRLWPWPYGAQSKNVGLDGHAEQSETGQAAALRAEREEVRLLYVAMTRARDYLILAVDRPNADLKAAALDGLVDSAGAPLLKLPHSLDQPLGAGNANHACRVWTLEEASAEGPVGDDFKPVYGLVSPRHEMAVPHPPYRFRPSDHSQQAEEPARIVESIALGSRLALTGSPNMAALGDAVHGFLAADSTKAELPKRREMAERLMMRWGVGGALGPDDVVAAADRLWAYCSKTWPGAPIVREWPVVGRVGLQRVQGRIDLLIETKQGLVIIDHKTYPGRPDTWEERVVGYGPQLDLYGRLCASATGKPIAGLFVHLPVVGAILRIEPVATDTPPGRTASQTG